MAHQQTRTGVVMYLNSISGHHQVYKPLQAWLHLRSYARYQLFSPHHCATYFVCSHFSISHMLTHINLCTSFNVSIKTLVRR